MEPDTAGGRHAGWDAARIHALISSMPGAVYRYVHRDGGWHMVSVTDAIEAITGYPAATFLPGGERPYDDVIHPDDRDAVAAAARQAMAERQPFAIEYRIIHADGSIRWVNGHGNGIAGDDGSFLYADGVIFDVTERKETEARLAEARSEIQQRRFAQRQIAEINDRIIASLVEATTSLDAGDERGAKRAIQQTLTEASKIITDLRALPQAR